MKSRNILEKNSEYVVEIENTTIKGQGVVKTFEKVLFVIGAVKYDKVKVRVIKVYKSYAIAKIIEIIIPSKYRIEPKCKAYLKCGGCDLMHIKYDYQLKIKESQIKENLIRIGKVETKVIEGTWKGITGAKKQERYRNKTIYPVKTGKTGEIQIGFYKKRTHEIIESNCLVGQEIDEKIKSIIKRWITENNILIYDEKSGHGILRHIIIRHSNNLKELDFILVLNQKEKEFVEKIKSLLLELKKEEEIEKRISGLFISVNNEMNNVIMNSKCERVWATNKEHENGFKDNVGNIEYIIPPESFYQINVYQVEKLYNKINNLLEIIESKNRKVWDLFCGIGSIGIYVADNSKEVVGIDIVEESIYIAKKNAAINNKKNITFKKIDLFKDLKEIDIKREDIVIVDPPRKGLSSSLIDLIIEKEPKDIIYVSCDCATLSRDICFLTKGGYSIKNISAVDMFPYTEHVECVVLMSKVEGK